MNNGERNELRLALALIYYRDQVTYPVKLPRLGKINNIGFAEREYGICPHGFNLQDIKSLSDSELERICFSLGISKAATRSKADIYINGIGVSIKYEGAAPPAIVNHTARHGWVMAARHNQGNMPDLDAIIDQYWSLRESSCIREDVCNSNSASPFRDHIDVLSPFLEYFAFIGTGSGLSNNQAQFLLEFDNLESPQSWKIQKPNEAVKVLWKRLVFSVRSKKGMPSGYPNNTNRSNNKSIAKWTRFWQGDHRGALHVRVRN